MVLRLRKSLYGPKQSSHVWYGTLSDIVIPIGFVASCVDSGLFVLEDQGIVVAAVVLHVDDLLIIATKCLTGQIKDRMKKRFQMHDLGSVSLYLGMNIQHNREHHTIDIHQHSDIQMSLAKFWMDESRPLAKPMEKELHKRKPDKDACDPTIYQSMIGCLVYTMTTTQPDIGYAMGVVSQYNDDPSNEHIQDLKCMFRYLNDSKDRGSASQRSTRRRTRRSRWRHTLMLCWFGLCCMPGSLQTNKWTGYPLRKSGQPEIEKAEVDCQSMTDAKFYAFGVGCMRDT